MSNEISKQERIRILSMMEHETKELEFHSYWVAHYAGRLNMHDIGNKHRALRSQFQEQLKEIRIKIAQEKS